MNLSNAFLRIAVLFALVGICMGAFMGGSGDHTLQAVHAHVNLLGWVSMFLYGLFYRMLPGAAVGVLPKVHFWLALLGLLIFMPALAVVLTGVAALRPIAGIGLMVGPMMILIGMILFAIIVFRATGRGTAAATATT